jgi:hypothetical protein
VAGDAAPVDLTDEDILPDDPPWVNRDSDYHAVQPADDLAKRLIIKIEQHRTSRELIALRCRANWHMYYSLDGGKARWSDNLYAEGEMGERVRLRVNIARNLIQHILVNTCSVKPAIDPLAKNTDADSTRVVSVARSIATETMEHKGGYKAANKATEYAEVLDFAFVEGEWDEMAGPVVNVDPATRRPIREGAHRFNVLTPLDVFCDLSLPSWDRVVEIDGVRKWHNKWDLIADFPELKDHILAAKTKGSADDKLYSELPSPVSDKTPESDLIAVFTYYHAKTPAVAMGRKMRYLASGVPLDDDSLPYDEIPVWPLFPSEVIGTALGYGPLSSLGSSQEAFNKMLSMAATTLFTHGVSNIAVAKGMNMEATDFGGGNKIFEVDVPAGRAVTDVIAPIQLTQLPKEVLGFAEMLNSLAEQDAGLNKIVRGDPSGVTAGVAMSLYQAMAQQFSGPLEGSRADLIKSMVLWTWEALRVHSPNTERWVQLVGKGNREALTKFTGDTLKGMSRVDVSLGNPLSRTPAGKVQMVQLLKQDGQPLPPQVIADVMNTGNIDVAVGPDTEEQDLVRAENEMIMEGQTPTVMLGQDDALHIFGHASVGFSPGLAMNPLAKKAFEDHNRMHLQKMAQGDLVLLARRGMLQQGFASPMFGIPPAPAQGQGGKPGGGAPPAQEHAPPPSGQPHAPPPKPEGPPGSAVPNPVPIPPVPGHMPQQ